MADYKVSSMSELVRILKKHGKQRDRRAVLALRRAAKSTEKYIDATTIPVAFGDLKQSGHVETHKTGAKAVYDAPYSAAVEVGSRPHWMPLEPLIAWVKLRGMQALNKQGRIKSPKQFSKLKGTTTREHAMTVAEAIRNTMLTDGTDAIPIDAPRQVAKAIQLAIALKGTKPHWFAKKSLPAARAFVAEYVKEAIKDMSESDSLLG